MNKHIVLRGAGIALLLLLVSQNVVTFAVTPPPVLLVTNGGFGAYLGQLLRTEGLNLYDEKEIGEVTGAVLQQYDLVILGAGSLNDDQAFAITTYVNQGGRLLAMRPDSKIINLFGLGASAGPLNDGYLQIATGTSFDGGMPGAGLASATLQIHGPTDRYALGSGVNLASLYSNATNATAYPAVVGRTYGAGRAVAFLYDLPANIVLTRQGNPANANLDIDGDGVVRTHDLFQFSGGGSWVDLNRVPIPQADEQMRFFGRLVRQLVRRPLPQLWYFPGNQKTMLLLTADAHANPTSYYQQEIDSLNAYGAKMTFYITQASQPDNASVQAWRALGHEFGIHPYRSLPPDINNLAQGYADFAAWFASTYSSPRSRTVRHHEAAWWGYTDAVELAKDYGMAFDTNYYHSGRFLQRPDGSWAHGYITGSGLSMKFAKVDGRILPVFQHETHLVDEQLIVNAGVAREGLTAAQGELVSRALIDASQAGYFSALMTQFHVDYYVNGDPQEWAERTMAYAQSLNIPMWNVDRWLSFTEMRYGANFSNFVWDVVFGRLTFALNATPVPGETLTTLIPLTYQNFPLLSIQVDGGSVQTAPFNTIDVRGVPMAYVTLPSGPHSFRVEYDTVYADVEMSLSAPSTVVSGVQMTYTMSATNRGADPATGVRAVLNLPASGVIYNGYNGSNWSCSNAAGMVTCDYSGSIQPSNTKNVNIVVGVPVETNGILNASAVVSSNEPDPDLVNNVDAVSTQAGRISDLAIDLSGSANPILGGAPFTYTLNVQNLGPDPALNVSASLALASGVNYMSTEATGWDCEFDEPLNKVTCTQSSLAMGSAPAILVHVLAPDEGADIVGSANVTLTSMDSSMGNNGDSLTTGLYYSSDLSIQLTGANDPILAGSSFTYTLGVSNAGPSEAKNLTAVLTLPAGAAYVSTSATGWSCGYNGLMHQVTCVYDLPLAIGSAAPIEVNVTAPTSGTTFEAAATATSASIDPDPANNSKTLMMELYYKLFLPLLTKMP